MEEKFDINVYEKPKMEVVNFSRDDVIATSGCDRFGCVGEDI